VRVRSTSVRGACDFTSAKRDTSAGCLAIFENHPIPCILCGKVQGPGAGEAPTLFTMLVYVALDSLESLDRRVTLI